MKNRYIDVIVAMPVYPFEITAHNLLAGYRARKKRCAQILVTTELHVCSELF